MSHLLCIPSPCTIPSPLPYTRCSGDLQTRRQHSSGVLPVPGRMEQERNRAPSPESHLLIVPRTEMRSLSCSLLPLGGIHLWNGGGAVGAWGALSLGEIISHDMSTRESSLRKGICKNLAPMLKIRQAPGVPLLLSFSALWCLRSFLLILHLPVSL